MKCDWKECKIGDFAEVKGGKRLPKDSRLTSTPNSHPYIRIRDLGKSKTLELTPDYEYVDDETQAIISRYTVDVGDILISVVGTIGLVGIVGETLHRANQTENCDKIVNLRGVDRNYLYYYLVSPLGQSEIEKATVGAVQPKLPIKNILDIVVKLPPLETQRKIASVLSSLDDKIELNNKINANLEEQAKAIFKSWFVDFEPFGGKMPEDWKYGAFGSIANISSGKRPPMRASGATEEIKIPLVGASAIMGYVNKANYEEKILIIGRVGTHGIVQRFNSPCWASDNTLVIKSPYYEYSYQILQRIDYSALNVGSTQPLITQGDLNKTKILLPDKQTLCRYESVVGTLMEKHEGNAIENEKLSSLRDALIPRLLSGELDVSKLTL